MTFAPCQNQNERSEGGDTQGIRMQKVCELETQLAESIRHNNEESASLQNQLVQLWSRLEQGEAGRQQLEYQLALAQREAAECRDILEEREREFQSLQSTLNDRVSKLSQQCQDWKNTLETVQQARAQERAEHQHLLSLKEEQLSRSHSRYEELECIKEQLEIDLIQEKGTVTELQSKLQYTEGDLNDKRDVILRQTQDLEAASERERKLQNELQAALHRVKLLGDSLEMEKAAQLDRKFSSEITQLRVKELEGSLTSEREAREEASTALAEARQRLDILQSSLETENRKQVRLQEKLHSMELESRSLEQQVKDKQSVISDLSEQLSIHKGNFESLKQELTQAKQHVCQVEESYGGCIKEVGSLLECFHTSAGEKTRSHSLDPAGSAPNPSHVVQMLRGVLTDLQAQMVATKSELQASQQDVERLSAECFTYKEVVTTRTSAMAEAEQRLRKSEQELSRLNSELSRSRLQLSSVKCELEGVRKKAEGEKNQLRELREELLSLKKQHSSDNKAHCQFLQTLQEHLQTISTPDSHHPLHTSTPTHLSHTTSWRKLSTAVNTTAASLTEAMRRTTNEVVQLRSAVQSQQSTLESTQTMHREAVAKLTDTLERHEQEWAQKHLDLHTHYESLLSEVEERAQKFQQCADEALQKAERLATSNQHVETEMSRLQDIHQTYKNDRACLLTCAGLLAGLLFPALGRIQQLVMHQLFLQKQLSGHQKLQKQVCELVALIQDDIGSPSPAENGSSGTPSPAPPPVMGCSGSERHPLLRFRKLVIVVLAAKRLVKLCAESASIFPISSGCKSLNHLRVHIGMKVSHKKRHGVVRPPLKCSDKDLVRWLRSETLLLEVRESFTDLQSTLDACTAPQSQQLRGGRRVRATSLHSKRRPELEMSTIAPTEASLTTFLEKVASHFPPTPHPAPSPPSHASLFAPSDSLWCRLGEGLASILRANLPPLAGYTTCCELGEVLHTQLMSLVGRLHDGELDRQSLRSQLVESRTECEQLSSTCSELCGLRQQVETLQSELKSTVPGEHFEAVCADLQRVLQREREAHATLSQQTTALQQLHARLQLLAQEVQSKDTALTETIKELSDSHLALHHRDQELRHVGRRLQQVEEESRLQAQQLQGTQNALQQAITEKEAIMELVQCAEAAFSQSKQKLSEAEKSGRLVDISHLILKATEEFALQRPAFGAELNSCQLMLKSFVDAHQCALSCLATLHNQVASCESHIAALKGELSAACRRQIAEASASFSLAFQEQKTSHPATPPADEFIPLQEHLSESGAETLPMTVEEPTPWKARKTSPADDPLLIASQGARLGAQLAKSLNL